MIQLHFGAMNRLVVLSSARFKVSQFYEIENFAMDVNAENTITQSKRMNPTQSVSCI